MLLLCLNEIKMYTAEKILEDAKIGIDDIFKKIVDCFPGTVDKIQPESRIT